jgi:hypothetical protein
MQWLHRNGDGGIMSLLACTLTAEYHNNGVACHNQDLDLKPEIIVFLPPVTCHLYSGREWLDRMLYTMLFCICEIQIKHGISHLLLFIEWLPFRLQVERYTHCTCTMLVYPLKLFRILSLAYGKLGLFITILNNNLWEPLRAVFIFKILELRPLGLPARSQSLYRLCFPSCSCKV